MPYVKAEDYHEMCGDLIKKNVIIQDLERELKKYKKLYFGAIQEQEKLATNYKDKNEELKKEQEKEKEWIFDLEEMFENIKKKYDSLETALDHYGGDWDEEIGICVDCENYKGFDEMEKHPNGYYCAECYKLHLIAERLLLC